MFTSGVTITEADTTYDGQDIVIDGATVTIDGPHSFNSIQLINSAVLTHSACTATATHKLELTVANEFVVDASSKIDVSGKGYVGGRTSGNITEGAAAGSGGGSYGGLGGTWGGSRVNAVYGDYAEPDDWGSGGGPDGGSGGGLVQVQAQRLQLEGALVADGRVAGQFAGSGGGVMVVVTELVGAGWMRAAGADGRTYYGWPSSSVGGGGGGGRIAVYGQDYSQFGLTNITAPGGKGGDNATPGGAGTVFLKQTGQPHGTLIVDSRSGGAGWTPLGLPGVNLLTLTDAVVIRGDRTHVRAEHAGLVLDFQNTLTIEEQGHFLVEEDFELRPPVNFSLQSGGYLEVRGAFRLELPLELTGGARLSVTGAFTPSLPVAVSAGAFLLLSQAFTSSVPLTIRSGGRVQVSGGFTAQAPLTLESNAVLELSGTFTSEMPLLVNGSTLSADQVVVPELVLTNIAVLTCAASTASEMHKLVVVVAGTVFVDGSSRIDVSGKGYVGGRTSGNITEGAAAGSGGGSYGGLGGTWGGSRVNAVYGDYAEPDDWGSGGGPDGGSGGGLVQVQAQRLQLEGALVADGRVAGQFAGSGGGVMVVVTELVGTGWMRAAGADGKTYYGWPSSSVGGGGGGGRIAVYGQDYSQFGLTNITAPGGKGGDNATPGGAGTVHTARGRPHTHVRSFQPAGRNGGLVGNESPSIRNRLGYLSNSFSGFVLEFNKPVKSDSLAGNLVLTGPAGAIVPIALAEIGGPRYEVTLPTFTENGSYRAVLHPTLLDTEGFPLDQNANGVPGEPEDVYTFTLIVDTVPPRATQHSPAGDIAGTIEQVDIWFSETIDKATLSSADISILRPDDQPIAVNTIQEVGFNRFRIAFAPQTAVGFYKFRVTPDVLDLAGNPLTTDYSFTVSLVPVDLGLNNVTVIANPLIAGDTVTISWNGRNSSGAPLLGNWTDAAYLSKDDKWDITDLRLATVPHTGGLAENEVYSASATVFVPGLLPSNYHVVIRADIYNQEKEGADEANNQIAFGPLPLSVRSLAANGAAISGTLTPSSRAHYYAVHLAAGESLRLNLDGSGASGANELHVNFESIPTRLRSDQRAAGGGQDQQIVLTGAAGGGTYYILVYGDQISGTTPYDLAAETGTFFISRVTPERHGNSHPGTITVEGAGFDLETTVEFLGAGGAVRVPTKTDFLSSTTLRLDLDLPGWLPGNYDVRVTKGATAKVRPNSFAIVFGGEPKLQTDLEVPGSLVVRGKQTLWLTYRNVGDAPMPAPILKVAGGQGALLTADSATAERVSRQSGWPPRGVGHEVEVLAIGSGATPGILQPGDSGRIPVYYLGITEPFQGFSVGVAFDRSELTFKDFSRSVSSRVKISDNPEIWRITETVIDFSIDWSGAGASAAPAGGGGSAALAAAPPLSLQEQMRPETVPSDAWGAIWQNLSSQIGSQFSDYAVTLADDANHLAKVGQRVTHVPALFGFEVTQAAATLNPIRTLASSVDASVPAPGFPLVFSRVFGQPIISRYRLGPLGRGWSHNWDISIQLLSSGDVLLRGPLGADRFFTRNSNGSYSPSPGDNGALVLSGEGYRLTETDKSIWQFRSDQLLDYVEESNSNRITCAYTGGLLTALTHSNGKQLLFDYDANGRVRHLTDPLGPGAEDDRVTTYEYVGEHLGSVTKLGNRITRYTYATGTTPPREHALLAIEYADSTHNFFAYDDRGRLTETSADGGAQPVTFTYDSAGTVTVRDVTGRTTVLSYGLGEQLAQVRDGEGRIVNFGYDTNSFLSQLVGPGGETYRYSYDAKSALTGIEDPLRHLNAFTYETNFSRLARVTDARQNGLQYTYDTRGNLAAITYADSTRESFGYDDAGNLISSTNRRGQVITYAYNSAGQLTSKDYASTPGFVDFVYAYDTAGNLISARDANGTNTMAYDPQTDRLTSIAYPGGHSFTFAYDNAGRRTQRLDQDGKLVAYLYDPIGRLEWMTNGAGGLIVHYEYDSAGRLSRKALGNDVFATYEYNAAGQVLHLINRKADGPVLSRFDYEYDGSGRRISMATLEGTWTYGYDALGQLTQVTHPGGRVVAYVYDAAGNRTQVTDNGVPTPYTANELNQYTSVGGATYLFDVDGNLTNTTAGGITTTYAYNTENRLIGVSTPTDSWTYEYDAFGNRFASAHNGVTTRYVIDPTGLGNVAAEYDGGGNLIARYDHGFGLLNRSDAAGNPAYYTFSAIGHTSELTDPTGAVLNSYAYDPFGVSVVKTEAIPNPFEFVGEYGVMNEGNGLEFMRARFYDYSSGKFVQKDPIGILGGLNLYAYSRNRPASAIDPLGLDTIDDLAEIVDNILDIRLILTGRYEPGSAGQPGMAQAIVEAGRELRRWAHSTPSYHAPDPIPGFPGPDPAVPFPPYDFWPPTDFLPPSRTSDNSGYDVNESENTPHIPPDSSKKLGWSTKTTTKVSYIYISHDPNDKVGSIGYGAAGYVPANGALNYQVRFENDSNAAAPAQRVVVLDTLDASLDLSTFALTEIAFADQVIPVPAGLSHYETMLMMSSGTSLILVDVEAVLDFDTRELRLTLTALDPNTGWLPEGPDIGFLYPNDTSGRGEGSISYSISPRAGLPSGTAIRNRARIYFDYNDPIDTPEILITIDSGPPSSSVTALPAEVGSTFLVQWGGQDETGGSGLANYDIYIIVNGTNQFNWFEKTTATNAWWNGNPGSTYVFYSVARDNVGNEEAPPAVADTQATVPGNAPPAVAPISDQTINEGSELNFAVVATDANSPPQILTFSLASGAPTGALIDATTGLFSWAPSEIQGPGSNAIDIIVTDNGEPPLSATNSFTVVVKEVNTAPMLAAIEDKTVMAGEELSFITMATDLDLPANALTFSLGDGAPFGAGIDSASGRFIWRPTTDQAANSNLITIRVTDDGVPSLDDSKSFTVVVERAVELRITGMSMAADGKFSFSWSARSGKKYRVQYKNSLADAVWLEFGADVVANGPTLSFTDDLNENGQRFYRVVQQE